MQAVVSGQRSETLFGPGGGQRIRSTVIDQVCVLVRPVCQGIFSMDLDDLDVCCQRKSHMLHSLVEVAGAQLEIALRLFC